MCLIDDDGERCEVWNERFVVARKPHRCSCCFAAIAPGDRYLIHFSVYEGDGTHEKMCAVCDQARGEFARAHGDYTTVPSNFPYLLSHCIGDGDEDSKRWQTMLDSLNARRVKRAGEGR